MEITMLQSAKILRVLGASLALLVTAGCAEQASSPPQASAQNGLELAGAWYQIFFDTNKTEIDGRGQMVVKNVAYVVANTDTTRVTVIGKADRVGSASANVALSQRRADQVRDALITAGVPSTRIDTSWTGEAKQDVITVNDEAERRNRVVDITVVKLSP
jgi:OOP family OmpA-OmpF porin